MYCTDCFSIAHQPTPSTPGDVSWKVLLMPASTLIRARRQGVRKAGSGRGLLPSVTGPRKGGPKNGAGRAQAAPYRDRPERASIPFALDAIDNSTADFS